MPLEPVYVVNSSRSKPINTWTVGDLAIHIGFSLEHSPGLKYENEHEFFGSTPMPPLTLSSDFLTCLHAEDAVYGDKEAYELLQYLDATTIRTLGEESPVNDFVVALLRALNFAPKGTMIRTRKDFPFLSYCDIQNVKADVCILEGTDPVLIIQEDKSHLDPFHNAFVGLITTALASFCADSSHRAQYNIMERRNDIVYGIIMNGSWPTFFKIPGLRQLDMVWRSKLINGGSYSSWRGIKIRAYRPGVPRPLQREREGMKPLDSRKVILHSFLRFKHLVFENAGKGMYSFSENNRSLTLIGIKSIQGTYQGRFLVQKIKMAGDKERIRMERPSNCTMSRLFFSASQPTLSIFYNRMRIWIYTNIGNLNLNT